MLHDMRLTWRSVHGGGLDELRIERTGQHTVAQGSAVGADPDEGTEWSVEYRIVVDEHRCTREVDLLDVVTGKRLRLRTDGAGTWDDHAELRGCLDVDLRATAYSNTLPIRRLELPVGASATIHVAYVDVPSLQVSREVQHYTRLGEHRWRFAQPAADFTVELDVDDCGHVRDYPGLFERVDPNVTGVIGHEE